MNRYIGCFIVFFVATTVAAQTFTADVQPLVESSCIHCHDEGTETHLDFEQLDHDLSDPRTFGRWEQVFDRVAKGEMPPNSEDRPDEEQRSKTLAFLKRKLAETNRAVQKKQGRVPRRRLTRTEYEYTLHDLLAIGGELAKHLPPENASSNFDTVSTAQGISPVHIRSYLDAADVALDEAIQLGPKPPRQPIDIDYMRSPYVRMWLDRPLRRGGNIIKMTDDAFVTFDSRPHLAQSNHMGYRPPYPGRYRITAEAYGYQLRSPVTLLLNRSSDEQGETRLIGAFDLGPQPRLIEVESYFTPDDFFYPALADDDWQLDGRSIFMGIGAKNYTGEGVAIRWLKIEGPLEENWPPESTRRLMVGVEFENRSPEGHRGRGYSIPSRGASSDYQRVTDIVENLAPLAFRRPVRKGEVEAFVRLAKPAIDQRLALEKTVRAPLRALLSSPQFLFHASDPGPLDDYALATRLSYFLWKSLPDEELFYLARDRKLRDRDVLAQQVDRMLDDNKSDRFVRDFLDSWLGLRNIDATTPDDKLYPEYDDNLRWAVLGETRRFFRELIDENLSARNLIDSDFTFVNRRLALHYDLPRVDGEQLRRVSLPSYSVRGGLLTQASVLKVTANGTVTSPVKRGSFVLTTLLGTPPSTPPPGAGAIEPDTRGTTTIRETLDAHRNIEACASCHRTIDPPGFAMECFDPVGGFRDRYRSSEEGDWPNRKLFGRHTQYKEGLPVDASGTTADGRHFEGIREFKQHLLTQTDQVARHLISQLVVYSTGGKIQFADRQEIERILEATRKNGYPVRTIIHLVVQSEIFRNK